jgi:hypothetical protein
LINLSAAGQKNQFRRGLLWRKGIDIYARAPLKACDPGECRLNPGVEVMSLRKWKAIMAAVMPVAIGMGFNQHLHVPPAEILGILAMIL